MQTPIKVEVYEQASGRHPFEEWLDGIKDNRAKARIRMRITRLRAGNFGDRKSLGQGLHELRIDVGKGYRVYFAEVGSVLVLLLCAGHKATQNKDIETARGYLHDYRQRSERRSP